VLQNADELFACDELSAASDIGWPDMFNSGVFVFRPSNSTYKGLLHTALTEGSFDGGDQGLLNTYFHDWRLKDPRFRLSFIYNMSSNVMYSYTAAYRKFGKTVKIVHFLGAVKPWHHKWTMGGLLYRPDSYHLVAHIQYWWSVFTEDVQPRIKSEYWNLAGNSGAIPPQPGQSPIMIASTVASASQATTSKMAGETPSAAAPTEAQHRRAVEAGNVDYLGKDSWENIQKRLNKSLGINE